MKDYKSIFLIILLLNAFSEFPSAPDEPIRGERNLVTVNVAAMDRSGDSIRGKKFRLSNHRGYLSPKAA